MSIIIENNHIHKEKKKKKRISNKQYTVSIFLKIKSSTESIIMYIHI